MGRKIKNILLILLGCVVIVVMIYVIIIQRRSICNEIHVKIEYQNSDTIIKPEDILNYLDQQKIKIKGEYIKNLNLNNIHQLLIHYPYIQDLNLATNVSHQFYINIVQSKPLMHVFNNANEEFFIDDNGQYLPYSQYVKEPLIIVNGNISNSYKTNQKINIDTARNILDHCFKIVQYLSKDDFLKTQFGQIYVNKDQDIEMIPIYGEHLVILRNSELIAEKMESVKAMYKNVFNTKGWNKYKELNLKYENVIIGVKY